MKGKFSLVLLMGLIALATIVPMQQVFGYTPEERLRLGDVIELASVRGTAYWRDGNGPTEANLSLKLTVTSVNDTHAKFTITSGELSFGGKVYTISGGQGGALLRRFGWVTLRGDASLPAGGAFKFRLEGMLHFERPRLVLAGLAGGLGNETEQIHLRLLVRVSRAS